MEAIVGIIYAILTFFGTTSIIDTLETKMLSYPNIFTLDQAIKYSTIALTIGWLVALFISLLEIRASKDNTKILLPFIFAIINFVLEIVDVVKNGIKVNMLFSLALIILTFIVCLKIFIDNKKIS